MTVTCLCITRNRREWLPKAIECFQRQTFPDAELLIVADGDSVHSLVPSDDSRVRLVYSDPMRIGDKRNFGCERARGQIICHWDDDDFSAPGRLADQVARLQETDKAVTGYRTMAFTDGTGWWEYAGHPAFAFGTSLCYRRDWWQDHRFASVQIGEDNLFVGHAAAAKELVLSNAREMMYATIHAGNTSARGSLRGPMWRELPGFRWQDAA